MEDIAIAYRTIPDALLTSKPINFLEKHLVD